MYKKITLPNGVRIVTEKVDYVRSASIGIWVGNGSRHEPKEIGGISHFIEHMIFKGTETRSAQDIAVQMDALGGQFNAFTTKECTCYYMKVLNTHIKEGIEILADMFLNSKFSQEDINLERGVVFEEIDMYEDSPEDLATEKLFENCYEDSSLGSPVLGTKETLSKMTTDILHDYMKSSYRPEDTVIAISGMFEQDDLDFICDLFSHMTGKGKNQITQAIYIPKSRVYKKDIEQNHICIGFKSVSISSDERYVMQILSSMLGGGMSSRLFQTVREKNGLCYCIYSFNASHIDTGMLSIYTALGKETEEKAIKLIKNVIDDFAQNGITQDELLRCREQLKSNVLMGLENTSARMHQIGKGELYFGRQIETDEIIQKYDAVTTEDVLKLARNVLDFNNVAISAVGQVSSEDYYLSLLK